MPLHSDYITPTFLLTLIFVQITFIIYFNYNALRTYGENQVIFLTGTDPQCQYDDIAEINIKNKCVSGKEYQDDYFVTTPENSFVLGTVPKTNVAVCTPLCAASEGSISKTGDCSKSIAAYSNCLADLVPVPGCKEAAKPLAKLVISPTSTRYYYAQTVLTKTSEC